MKILALETSCDETSAAVVEGTRVLSNVVASQIEMHRKWGGVVPEAAARAHVEALLPTLREALSQAETPSEEIGGIAVTNRPGLVGALSVGVTAAKALSLAWNVPLLGVHHLEGHLSAILAVEPNPVFPFAALIVSGGHTELIEVTEWGIYRVLGGTRDDAAGEAFDKSARLLGLGYPGGRAIQERARSGNPKRYPLPKGLKGDTLDFSFSGLKTAVLRLAEKEGDALSIPDAAASLQEAVVAVLSERAAKAAERGGYRMLALVGGVAANEALRERLRGECGRRGIAFVTPPFYLCTDNAGMIGLAATWRFERGDRDDLSLEALANAEL
ncbi:tRNA (adenosine(37)-N6)-threonylcarbamoyltransferase complex transferase subunit TsaD [bacterium]|nr:MAG: tRNA (adenosine(37)-N6)-threonylcarbamoyltransferase complex transferase subunit TsaD [bacterium]